MLADGRSIYTLDDAKIRAIAPDVILAQDLCAVCAIDSGAVEDALDVIGCRAQVVSLDPAGLDDVIECVVQVGRATGTEDVAAAYVAGLRRATGGGAQTRRRPGDATGLRPRMAGPAVQRGTLDARNGGGRGWRTRPRRGPSSLAPPDVGGDRRRDDRRHDLHSLRVRPCRCRRASGLVPDPTGSSRLGPRRRGQRQRILLATRSARRGRRRAARGDTPPVPARRSDSRMPRSWRNDPAAPQRAARHQRRDGAGGPRNSARRRVWSSASTARRTASATARSARRTFLITARLSFSITDRTASA